MNEVCWYGDCDTTTQGQLASFMQCYEGESAHRITFYSTCNCFPPRHRRTAARPPPRPYTPLNTHIPTSPTSTLLPPQSGPGANSEAEIDPSTRSPCLDQAGFDAEEVMDRVMACTDDETRLDSIKGTLNTSKGAADQHHRWRCSDRRPSSVSTADSPAAARSPLPHLSLPRPLPPSFYLPLSHT